MRRHATFGLLAALTIGAAGPAFAQNIPPGQSCGGLFCDMGIFGHKVPLGPNGEAPTPQQMAASEAQVEATDPHRLPCHDFLCRAFGQKDAEAAPPPPPIATVAPAPEPTPHKMVHKRHAKLVAARTAAPAEPAAEPMSAK